MTERQGRAHRRHPSSTPYLGSDPLVSLSSAMALLPLLSLLLPPSFLCPLQKLVMSVHSSRSIAGQSILATK
jgi:hypothetical protein